MVVVNVLLLKAHVDSVFDKEEIDGDLIDNHADEVDDIGSADAGWQDLAGFRRGQKWP